MKTHCVLFLTCILSVCGFTGCGNGGGNLAPVTGTVMLDGTPLTEAQVIFFPLADEKSGSTDPGPFSSGITDSQGKFTLKTRYDKAGAVIGKHKIQFKYSDLAPDGADSIREKIYDLKIDAREDGRALNSEEKAEIADLQAKIKSVFGGRRPIPAHYSRQVKMEVEVTQGENNPVFELVSDEK